MGFLKDLFKGISKSETIEVGNDSDCIEEINNIEEPCGQEVMNDDIDKVKCFIEEFCQAEATLKTLENKIDVAPYNDQLPKYYSYYISSLNNAMGFVRNEGWDEVILEVMGDIESRPPYKSGIVFKISQYTSDTYGKVWVAYVSSAGPRSIYDLSKALFVVEEDGKLKIARVCLLANIGNDEIKYVWKSYEGHQDLSFDSIKGPEKIERYEEPSPNLDGLIHYHAES